VGAGRWEAASLQCCRPLGQLATAGGHLGEGGEPFSIDASNPIDKSLVVITVACLRRWGSFPQHDACLVITRHNKCAIGVKADLTDSLSNGKPAKVCHHSRRDLWLDMRRNVKAICRCLAEGRDKGLGNI